MEPGGEANSPVRIGFIGGGGNARGHRQRRPKGPGAQIAGGCDVVPAVSLAANESARTGVPVPVPAVSLAANESARTGVPVPVPAV